MNDSIPDNLAIAAVSMLAPYVPGLTVERLLMAIGYIPESEQERLSTRRETAAKLRLSIPTIDRMLRAGELEKITIRGSVRIPSSSIERILQGHRASS